jgi:hypothetical protein
LFCPGIGIAVDSCAALIVAFVRPGGGSALIAPAGMALVEGNTDPADGAVESGTDTAVAGDSVDTGWLAMGVAAGVCVLSHAPRHSARAQSAITENVVDVQLPILITWRSTE